MKREVKVIEQIFKKCNAAGNCTFPKGPKMDEEIKHTGHHKLTATEYIAIMDENFGWCDNPYNPYTKVKEWLNTGELDYANCNFKDDILENITPV